MTRSLMLLCVVSLLGCGDPPPPAERPVTAEPEVVPPPVEVPTTDPDLVCARVLVVSFQGAVAAASTVTRNEDEARERAENLLARIEGGERFADVARAESDASSSGPRGGLLGTYTRRDWPEAHEAIAPRLFGMRIGEISEVIHAPYGWVLAERCPTELAHTRHLLIRFAGARNAPPELTRTRAEARDLIDPLRSQILAGADLEALVREHSEDSSAERGGDMGTLGRGRMTESYELAAFALPEGAVSDVVESEFGFHLIQRLPL